MMHPDAINKHARGEWILGINDGLREFETSTAMLKKTRLVPTQNPDKCARYCVGRAGWISTFKNVRLIRFGKIGQDHGTCWRSVGPIHCDLVQVCDERIITIFFRTRHVVWRISSR